MFRRRCTRACRQGPRTGTTRPRSPSCPAGANADPHRNCRAAQAVPHHPTPDRVAPWRRRSARSVRCRARTGGCAVDGSGTRAVSPQEPLSVRVGHRPDVPPPAARWDKARIPCVTALVIRTACARAGRTATPKEGETNFPVPEARRSRDPGHRSAARAVKDAVVARPCDSDVDTGRRRKLQGQARCRPGSGRVIDRSPAWPRGVGCRARCRRFRHARPTRASSETGRSITSSPGGGTHRRSETDPPAA